MSGPFVDQALQPGDQAAYPELKNDETVESKETTSFLASKVSEDAQNAVTTCGGA